MKNLFKLFVPVAAAAIALVSCQPKEEQIGNNPAGVVTIRVHATADNLKAGDQETKTYIDTYQNTANTILWGTGEYMKLALTAGETTTFENSTDTSADLFDGEPEAMFEFSVTPGEANEYVYQGLYPASAAATTTNTNAANYKVNLPAIQNATASSYDPAAYIMVAKPETFTSVQTDWEASYRRGTALNKITLKNVPDGVSFNKVKITAEGKKLAGGRHFNLTTGEGLEVYGTDATIEVLYATALTGTNVDVWFTSWDAEIAEGEKLTIIAYSTDNKSYKKEITVPAGKTIKFQEGYLNTLGATLSGITPEDVTELEEGSYVVLAKDGTNYYALKAEKESGKERLLSVAYTGDLTAYNGDADIIWNLTKSGDSFIFENGSKYLGYKGSSNESYWLAADENWTATNYLLDVAAQETAEQFYVTLHSNASKYLSKNSSADFFAFYGNTGQKADIVFVPATVDTRTAVTLSFAEDAISKTTSNYSEFTGQAATATPNESAITSAINYTMTGDAIGSITSESTVSLNGTTGTATVTATFAGDNTFRPATASYTITVSSSTGPQYELVSAANDVVAGDYIITWDNTYYLPSGSTSGTNPAVGTGITVASNRITNTVTSDMVWTFTGDNTNGFTISDGTNILHSTNAAQGISITTTSTRKWTASVDDTYGMLLHGDDGGSRYLSVYNSGSWRYYALGNSYSGILRLYKLLDSREDAPISWSAATGTATMSSNGISSTLPSLTNTNSLAVSYASSDETVATIANDGTVSILGAGITSISATYDGSAANATYKTTTVSYTLTVTDNRTACATPTFSPAAGEVEAGSSVSISCATEGATIHYTVDGTTPTTESAVYSSAITIDAAKTIKAIAVKANYKNSDVATAAYTIAAASSTVAQVLAGGAATDLKINNLLVYHVNGKNAIVGDATGKMLLYMTNTLTAGDNISIASGTTTDYQGTLEITAGTITTNSQGNTVDHGTATNLNDATVAGSTYTTFSGSGYHSAVYVSMTGNQAGRNITGDQEHTTLYLNVADATNDGKTVNVTGYIYSWSSTHSNYNFQCISIVEDTTTPTISVSPSSLSWAADETDSKPLTVTLNGSAAAGDYTYSVTSGTASNWTITKNNGTLTVAPNAANTDTENAKSITIRIAHASNNTVYQDVVCTQAKATSSTGPTPVDVTYDFSQISDFSSWGSSYSQHVVNYTEADVTFTSANHQTSTITSVPVTKGQPVSVVLKDGTMNSVSFTCTQWGTKAQTITLHYSTNGGTSYTSTSITSTNFTISSVSLPTGTNAVKITFSSTSNQVGIASVSFNYTPSN